MINLTRFTPIEPNFENLLRAVPVWLPNLEARAPESMPFRMDVTEDEKAYRVAAELPGVKKEEINITITGHDVAVAAEVKYEKALDNDAMVLRAERYYGKLQRTFTLAQAVDEATAHATYNDGVLALTLPKKTVAAAKRLAVQ